MLRRIGRSTGFPHHGFHRHFLTLCTAMRRPAFRDPEVVEAVTSQIRLTAQAESFAPIAYCFLCDQLHLLVGGASETADLREFVYGFKQQTSVAYKTACGAALWEDGYYDHVLRDAASAREVVRYILENPLRVRLTSAVEPYLGGSEMYRVSEIWAELTAARMSRVPTDRTG